MSKVHFPRSGGQQWVDSFYRHPDHTTGNARYVHSVTGTSTGPGFSPETAYATVDQAINASTASNGDFIYVMPGHVETIAAADGFDADVAGIAIIGLGWGSMRPTFTFTATSSTTAVGAANVRIENLRFVAGVSAVVVGLNVEAAGVAFTIRNCEFYWGDTTGYDFVGALNINVGAHRALVENCRFLAQPATAGASTGVQLVGAVNNVVVRNCEFSGDYSLACMSGITTLCQHLNFIDNLVYNPDASEPYLEVVTGTTGIISGTRGLAKGATIGANAVADAMAHCENFVVNTAGSIAVVVGAAVTTPPVDAD